VDDPTRQAVAQAVGVEIEYRPELWEQVRARFKRFGRLPTENNKRQAYVPQGAIVIENPVGTAPAFMVTVNGCTIIALPGVPHEMEHLIQYAVIPYLRTRFDIRSIIKARVLHTAGVGESQIDDRIGDLEALTNPTVGLAAHFGQVDIRITAKADGEAHADGLIAEIEESLRRRLGNWIYGADQDTLEQIVLNALQSKGWKLVILESGLNGELIRRIAPASGPFLAGQAIAHLPAPDEFPGIVDSYRSVYAAEVALGVAIRPGQDRKEIQIVIITPQGTQHFDRPYGGPPGYAPRWAANHSLDLLRSL
jgi:hypothetical protein